MDEKPPRPQPPLPRGLTIRAYVALWVASILAAFLVLLATWHVTEATLRRMRQQINSAAHALDLGRVLEASLLREEREDLLWRATGDAAHLERKLAALQEATAVAARLETVGVVPAELKLVDDLRAELHTFQAAASAAGPAITRERPRAEDVLTLVGQYMRMNEADLQQTTDEALRVRRVVDYSFLGVGILVAVVLAAGSVELVRRVVRPATELTRAARRFGRGDFEARARVLRDDELGELCRTFNAMAESLAAQEKNRLEFVATVAHDLKNPLVTIGGAARRLRRGGLDPERQAAWLDTIIKQCSRLEHLAHDLMDTVQVSTGRLTLEKREFDLTAALRELHAEQAEAFPRHHLVFEGEEECRIAGDRDRLERVAMNLLSNAVKYSPPGTTVRLRVTREHAHALFTVEDQGAGMSPEDLKVLFLPFGRGARAQTMAKGTGLGMCVVQQILDAHDGVITVHSQLGKGTTVEVRLPLARD